MGLINHKHVGLTGKIASGKGTAASILQEEGYVVLSFSDIIKDEAAQRGLEPVRRNLRMLGNELRATYGDGVLAYMALQRAALLPPDTKVVFDGIRHPDELLTLQKEGVYVAGIDAPDDIRYARYRQRNREGDAVSRRQFDEADRAEKRGKGGVHGQNIYACLPLANEIIVNNGTIDDLRMKLGLPPTTIEGQIDNDPQRRK